MPQVVRVEVGNPGRLAGSLHRVPERVAREALEDAPLGGTIVRRAGGLDLDHQPCGHAHPAPGRGRLARANAEAAAGHVDIPPLQSREFTDTHPALLEQEDGTPADPPRLDTAVPNWSAGDTIPLGRDRILRVVDVRPGQEPDEDPVLVVEAA